METDSCKRNLTHGHNRNCPDANRDGFVFSDEFSADWPDLDQTDVLVFHSWIAEYAKVQKITTGPDGRNEVKFQKIFQPSLNASHALKHAPIGDWGSEGGCRGLQQQG